MSRAEPIGIFYRQEAYSETTARQSGDTQRPQGLMGREVASRNFLHALLTNGHWSVLEAILNSEADRGAFTQTCQQVLSRSAAPRRVHITPLDELPQFLHSPKASIIHFPYPAESRFAEARQAAEASHGAHQVAFSGVTHTLCSQAAIEALWSFLHGAWRTYDRLICTSRAVADMVRSTIDAMRSHVLEATGTAPQLQIGIECIPLGVCTDTHRPPTPAERYEARRRLGIAHDRFVILFVGRLSHHSKSQPYPMLRAAQHAAHTTGGEVVLLQCGWYSNDAVREAYERTARRVAPNVRLITVDGLDAWWRQHVWDAADVFISLADSIQETFGLTVVEAMAHGLPVVASDWNGYRDTVDDGETGHLIPTRMVSGSLSRIAEQLVASEIGYDHFLALSSQAVEVSIRSACDALAGLATNPVQRQTLGQNARKRAEEKFSWPNIIKSYEALWQTQREELSAACAANRKTPVRPVQQTAKVFYPPVETCFASYPSEWLSSTSTLRLAESAEALNVLLDDPLLNHSVPWRDKHSDPQLAIERLKQNFTLEEIIQSGVEHPRDLAAWLLKYGVIELVQENTHERPWVTFVTTCMGRLADLQATLPHFLKQKSAAVVVVDYSCPQQSGDWARKAFPASVHPNLQVVEVPGARYFDRSAAKNAGVRASKTPWVCLIDADVVPTDDFAVNLQQLSEPMSIVRSSEVVDGTGGTFLFERRLFDAVGGHDLLFEGWGEQDEDLVDALRFEGALLKTFPAAWLQHRDHDDTARTQYHIDRDRRKTQLINRLYRAAKWDWARIIERPLTEQECRRLRDEIQTKLADSDRKTDSITLQLGIANWPLLGKTCERELRYKLSAIS